MKDTSGDRLTRLKRGYRRFAAVVAILLGTVTGWKFGTLDRGPSVGVAVVLGLMIGIVFFFMMLAVLATMQGRGTLSGRGNDKGGKR